jgi:hypothetical protein
LAQFAPIKKKEVEEIIEITYARKVSVGSLV